MKKLLRTFAFFLIMLLTGSLLTGCVASAGTAVDVGYGYGRPYYRPYYRPYRQPYYRPYYRPAPVVIVRPRPVIVRPTPRGRFYNYNVQPHRSIRVR